MKDLPRAQHLAVAPYFNGSNRFCRLKCGTDIVRHTLFFSLSNEESVASGEWIDAALLGVHLALWTWLARLYFHKFVVARPKRKLIHQVLRLSDVNGRMPRPLRSFVT